MITDSCNDVALDFATREKVVLKLALDPKAHVLAFEASKLHILYEQAQQRLEAFKADLRSYATQKRDVWNESCLDKVITVKIPYELKTERGVEVRFVSVSCTASYTVDPVIIGKFKKEYPKEYRKLFVEKTTKTLRDNSEFLLKSHLLNLGMPEDKVKALFSQIFEVSTEIKPVQDYEFIVEDVMKGASEGSKFLSLGVRRANPSVTF